MGRELITQTMHNLLRNHLNALPPYTPIEPFEVLSQRLGRPIHAIIKLDANENPYGPSPKARQALAEMDFPHIYPDPESRALRSALSRFSGVPVEHLAAGSGADELLDVILRLTLEPGDVVLNCPPSFGMYPFDTQVNAGRLVEVPRRSDFSLNLPEIRAAVQKFHPKVLFLASPNNPNGGMIAVQEIEELLSLPVLLVLDEAYIEFCDHGRLGEDASWIRRVPDYENLIVLRTFSKWAGLAGLRVGYGAFPAWLMPAFWKAKQPYNVNVAASLAALASLDDLDTLAEVVAVLRAERARLFAGLKQIPYLQPYPSQSNFILCKVVGRSAAALKACLAQSYGILLRYFDKPGVQDHIRISVGKPEHTTALLRALGEVA